MIWLTLALAADPQPSNTDAEDTDVEDTDSDEYVSEEVVVYGELRVQRAREKVINELNNLGYTRVIKKKGAIVLRHDDPWKGDVWLHEDGWMRIKRQPVRVEAPKTPWGKRNSAGSWLGCLLYPFLCVRPGGQIVSRRKFMAVETRTARAIDPDVSQWSDRVADLSLQRKVNAMPARLDALWSRGAPLEDADPVFETMEERKAALLRFWETRTDNIWGEGIRYSVEAFIRGVVQNSEHPFSDEEIALFNRQSRAARPLSLERPKRK